MVALPALTTSRHSDFAKTLVYRARVFGFDHGYGMIGDMDYAIALVLGLFGLLFGSFAGATVWRLRARQLREDMTAGEAVDTAEYAQLKPLMDETLKSDRSRCLHCGHQLAWYDLVPVVSWVSLGGKCRYCKAPIGRMELLIELGMAIFFAGSYLLWPGNLQAPLEVLRLALWLIAGVGLAILFVYDYKWFLLPDRVTYPLIGVAVLGAVLHVTQVSDHFGAALSVAGAVTLLSGLYWALWRVSKGGWVGFGDVKLGLVLALLLADWRLAFVALFAANLIGCLVVLPGLISKKLSRTTRVPFGPFLILGAIVAFFAGQPILDWYLAFSMMPPL